MGGIVWLASYPKSGNTWVRAFLHNLLRNATTPIDINRFDEFTLGDTNAKWYEQLTDKPYEQLSKEEQAALRPRVHQLLARTSPDSVFVKTHHFLGEDRGVPLISMEYTAGAIYIVRNPLDVLLSMQDHYGMTMDQAIDFLADDDAHAGGGGGHVHQVITSWSNHVRSWTLNPHSRLLVLRYEDMLRRPPKAFAKVTRFLGLKPPRDRLERAIRFSSFKVLRSQEDRHGFRERSSLAERFFRAGRSGQWKDVLTDAQVARLVNDHRAQMQRFRYVPPGF
jgi:hypothetical protein